MPFFLGRGIFLGMGVPFWGGGSLSPFIFFARIIQLGSNQVAPKYHCPRPSGSALKVHGRKKKEEKEERRIMPSLVATMLSTQKLRFWLTKLNSEKKKKISTYQANPFWEKSMFMEKEKVKEKMMPSLVATTSTPARKPFVRTHYVRTKSICLVEGHTYRV